MLAGFLFVCLFVFGLHVCVYTLVVLSLPWLFAVSFRLCVVCQFVESV